MILEGQKQGASGQAQDVVCRSLGILPGQGPDVVQDGIALLAERDEDGAWSVA